VDIVDSLTLGSDAPTRPRAAAAARCSNLSSPLPSQKQTTLRGLRSLSHGTAVQSLAAGSPSESTGKLLPPAPVTDEFGVPCPCSEGLGACVTLAVHRDSQGPTATCGPCQWRL
jgi:hypothetical protein